MDTKGVYIEAENKNGDIHKEVNIPSIAEGQRRLKRRYSLTLNSELKRVTLFVGTQKIEELTRYKEGSKTMGRLSDFQQSNAPSNAGHWATDDEKASLDMFEIPFYLKGSTVDVSPFKDKKTDEPVSYISYIVAIDTTSDEFAIAERKKQFNYTELIIKLVADADRMRDLAKMQELGYDKSESPDTKCKLVGFQGTDRSRKPYYKITDFDYQK